MLWQAGRYGLIVPQRAALDAAPGGGGPASPPSLDGSANANTGGGTTLSATLTTTNANDVICAFILTNGATNSISSVTDNSGVTAAWSKFASTSSGLDFELWYTTATAALSGASITMNCPSPTFITMHVFGVSGAHTASPFDGSGVISTSDPISITTSDANDLLIAGFRMSSTSNPTAGSGWTQIQGNHFQVSECKTAATAGTYSATIGTGVGDANEGIVAAIRGA